MIQLGREKADVARFDGLAFCSPVNGGLPAVEMKAYLERVSSLQGKKVICLATGFFPAKWGRNQTLASMKGMCESKGATVCGLGSVGWTSFTRNRQNR